MRDMIRMAFMTKTGRVALAGLATAVASYFEGKLGLEGLITAAFACVYALAQRHATEKAEGKNPDEGA